MVNCRDCLILDVFIIDTLSGIQDCILLKEKIFFFLKQKEEGAFLLH